MDPFEGLAAFAVTHELCPGQIDVATQRKHALVELTLRCPGCGASHAKTMDLEDVRTHVLSLARHGGFTGTLTELSEAEYDRILSSPPVVATFIALGHRARQFERPQ
jgi:hypothetical protein